MEPCQKEEIISNLSEKLHNMEVRQVKIDGNVEHIKGRLDNGMSHTIHNVDQALTKLQPIIEHHGDVIRRVEGMGWTLATSLLLTLLGFLAWGIAHGFKIA